MDGRRLAVGVEAYVVGGADGIGEVSISAIVVPAALEIVEGAAVDHEP